MAALVRIRLALAGSRRSSGTWLGCVRLALGRPSRQVRRARIFTALARGAVGREDGSGIAGVECSFSVVLSEERGRIQPCNLNATA